MAQIVDLRTEVVHRYVLELRYLLGHLYWDRCGRIVNEIISSEGNWDFENIEGGTCHLVAREKNLHFSFSALKLDLSQTQSSEVDKIEPVDHFGSVADSFSAKVTETLQLSEFSRIGFRTWYLYPTADRDESYRRVRSLKLLSPEINCLELGNVSEAACRLVIELPTHMVRVAVTTFEQVVNLPVGIVQVARAKAREHSRNQKQVLLDRLKAERIVKSYPQFGVLVDLDAFMDEPPYPNNLSVSEFITSAVASFDAVKTALLEDRA